MEIKDVDRWTG